MVYHTIADLEVCYWGTNDGDYHGENEKGDVVHSTEVFVEFTPLTDSSIDHVIFIRFEAN